LSAGARPPLFVPTRRTVSQKGMAFAASRARTEERVNGKKGALMADGELPATAQTKDAKIYTMVMAVWMVLLLLFGLLTIFGFFR
jgi:hypothetical protein